MRLLLLAATVCLLAACGGADDSQANSAQVNVGNGASPPPTAVATTVNSPTGKAVTGDEAKRIMHERHEGMERIGKAFKAIGRELKSPEPDSSVLARSGDAIVTLAHQAGGWFPPGTGPDAGKTGAKREIWENTDDFTAKLADLQKAADGFVSAQKTGSLAAIKAGAGDLGKACKACHDKYRSEMHR